MPQGILLGAENRFHWNLIERVGTFGPNLPDDVQMVQFAYFCMSRNPFVMDTKLLQLAAKITPGEAYAGRANEPLSQCIMRHQQVRGSVVDGRVSPITNATGSYGQGAQWLLLPLNVHMAFYVKDLWPRIDDHPDYPPFATRATRLSLVNGYPQYVL